MDRMDPATNWTAERNRERMGQHPNRRARRRRNQAEPMTPFITAYNPSAAAAYPEVFAAPPPPTITNYSQPYVSSPLKNAADRARKRQGII